MTTARKNFLLFGGSGPTNDFAQFGSETASAPLKTKDIETIQSLSAWVNGLQDAVFGGNNAPYLEDFNGLLYVFAYQLFYMLEKGVAEWDSETTYNTNSVVNGNGAFYFSKTNGNLNNALPAFGIDDANWAFGTYVLASRIQGLIQDAQIQAVGAAKITGQVTNAQIASMAATKLIGLVTDAQIQAMAASKLTGQVVNAQIASLDVSKLTGTIPVSPNSVGTAALKTGTGHLSAPAGGFTQITLNDYSFAPSFLADGPNQNYVIGFLSTDIPDTVARFGVGEIPGFTRGAYNIRWRYVTASDNPRIWAVVDAQGTIIAVWESEDPPNHGAISEGDDELCPFVQTEDMTTKGQTIVNIPIPEAGELQHVITSLGDKVVSAAFERYHKKIKAKEWISPHIEATRHHVEILSALPEHKKTMGRQWILRSLAGQTNVARFIREIGIYSHTDKRLIFPKQALAKIGPAGLLKESK